ncbi:coiled-coil domain-containing protein [Sansalvadorimonas verongulae]|uniref:hypothetical protein n=1 Tax=Sansalvadorimonas verongulae TaxID=2172824 RepID=UPI0012BC6565|nr:hypothetical protein [Sansalvadorimonas verongulae]MTI14507.1 hypothetical protein [Sansalvadorimonas verongulae]
MNSRSQDDLDHLPSISLSPDDMPERTPDRSKKASEKKVSSKTSTSKSSAQKDGGGSRFPISTIILSVAFLALAAGGYMQMQALQTELRDAQAQLKVTTSLLNDVSGAVSQTGETLSKSDNKVQDELKAVNFEIRKLWDLSNRRNRPNIETQTKRVDALSASVAKSGEELENSVNKIDKNTKELAEAEKRLAALRKEMQAVSADVVAGSTITREQVSDLQSTVDGLSATVKTVTSTSEGLNADIKNQVKDYGEKIKAIDAHRQQVNRRLLQLENSVRSLQSGSRSGLTVQPAAQNTSSGTGAAAKG